MSAESPEVRTRRAYAMAYTGRLSNPQKGLLVHLSKTENIRLVAWVLFSSGQYKAPAHICVYDIGECDGKSTVSISDPTSFEPKILYGEL